MQTENAGRDPKELAKLIEQNLDIPTIPAIASQALREMADPNVSGTKLGNLIAKDPGLTARILKVANSALYSPVREVKNIAQATMMLGFNTLKSVVVAASCKTIYKRFGEIEQKLWQHSMGCAIGAHVLSKAKMLPHRDEAFVAGLMHDIGKVIMNNGAGPKFQDAITLEREGGMTSAEAEQKVFGFTHMDVGSILVERWQLWEPLKHAIFLHHEPELASSLAEDCVDLVHVVHMANMYCHKLGFGIVTEPDAEMDMSVNDSAMELGFDDVALPALEAKIVETFAAEHQSLG